MVFILSTCVATILLIAICIIANEYRLLLKERAKEQAQYKDTLTEKDKIIADDKTACLETLAKYDATVLEKEELARTIEETVKLCEELVSVNAKLTKELESHEDILIKAAEIAEMPPRIAPMPIELDCPCGMHRQAIAVDLRHKHQDYSCGRCGKRCGIQVRVLTTQIPQGATLENYPLATQVGAASERN